MSDFHESDITTTHEIPTASVEMKLPVGEVFFDNSLERPEVNAVEQDLGIVAIDCLNKLH